MKTAKHICNWTIFGLFLGLCSFLECQTPHLVCSYFSLYLFIHFSLHFVVTIHPRYWAFFSGKKFICPYWHFTISQFTFVTIVFPQRKCHLFLLALHGCYSYFLLCCCCFQFLFLLAFLYCNRSLLVCFHGENHSPLTGTQGLVLTDFFGR